MISVIANPISLHDFLSCLRNFLREKYTRKKFEENAGVKVMLRHEAKDEGGYTFHYIRFNY